MRRFLLQSFLYSLILLSFISCKTYQLGNVKTVQNSEKTIENLYFSSNEDYVYKCQMDIYKNHVSGILIIKKISKKAHRVVLTTDFGNKMIDFELVDNDFKLNYVLPDLDKKIVINFLKNDFQKLLKRNFEVENVFADDLTKIYDSNNGKEVFFLSFNKENRLLKSIVYTKHRKEKINFTFEAKKPTFAEKIEIQHKDFKINIKLFQITETEQETE